MRRAFTLVELLAVIAIVAVLAAILFPVFASAKAAAKRTACLSNLKQIGVASGLYQSDHGDAYPITHAHLAEPSGMWHAGWQWEGNTYTPAVWDAAQTEEFVQANAAAWPNSLMPYLKSWATLSSPTQRNLTNDGVAALLATPAAEPRQSVDYTMNGALTEWSGTVIQSPSGLIAYWQGTGPWVVPGLAGANPSLYCPYPDQPCRYVPTPKDHRLTQNGQAEVISWFGTVWAHGHGLNVAMADGHAQYRKVGANPHGPSDYRTDPFTNYREDGTPGGAWFDGGFFHTLIFRPDFDFGDYEDRRS